MNRPRQPKRPSRLDAFLRGAGSILVLTPRPERRPGRVAGDWQAIGDDLRAVMGDAETALGTGSLRDGNRSRD